MSAKKISFCRTLSSVFLYAFSIVSISAQNDTINLRLKDSSEIFDNLFSQDEPLDCELKFNIKKYQKEKRFEKFNPANMYLYINDTTVLAKKVRLKSRGIFRKDNCSLPPFWLNIRRVKNKSDGISINEKYKVVTHCDFSPIYEEYLLKEYLMYKIFNMLSDNSFRVRLVRFTYIDSGRKNKSYERWGFLIESVEMMTKRLNSLEIKLNTIGMNYTDTTSTDLLCMYQYMMGNTDWSFTGQHNIKLIKSTNIDQPEIVPIPYDFDYAGFVNADYANPTEGLDIENVRERTFVGPCRKIINYQIAAQHLINNKEKISQVINDFEYLRKGARLDGINYLNEYYRNIERPDFIKYHIKADCYDPKE